MDYGNCVSCGYPLGDGNRRSVSRVSKQGYDMHSCCNDTQCQREAIEHGWTIRAYSGRTTNNQPGEKGIFKIE